MSWIVEFHKDFDVEFEKLSRPVRVEILALTELLGEFGPTLARPHADTLEGSRHANMKELRFDADGGVWRIAFAFDPRRRAILLVTGNKSGVSQKLFYRRLIRKADARFSAHLAGLKAKRK